MTPHITINIYFLGKSGLFKKYRTTIYNYLDGKNKDAYLRS